MNEFIMLELKFFLSSFLWGAILFAAYDLLRVYRNVFRHCKFVIAIEDIVFWIIAGILIFRMMYQMNDGTIRYYSIISILIGMKLYQVIFSVRIVILLSAVLLAIKNLIINFLHFLASPLQFVLKKIRMFFGFLTKMFKKRVGLIVSCLKKQLKKHTKKFKIKRKKKQLVPPEPKQEKQRGGLELIPMNKGEMK